VSCQRVNATGRATREVSVARARVVRGTEKPFAFEFKIHEGFVRSFGWISPGPLYSWKRGWQWFFTLPLALAFRFCFHNLRE
jgi:hypothetical protein